MTVYPKEQDGGRVWYLDSGLTLVLPNGEGEPFLRDATGVVMHVPVSGLLDLAQALNQCKVVAARRPKPKK